MYTQVSPTVGGFGLCKLAHSLNYYSRGFSGYKKRDDNVELSDAYLPSDVHVATLPSYQTNNSGGTDRDYRFKKPHLDKGSDEF